MITVMMTKRQTELEAFVMAQETNGVNAEVVKPIPQRRLLRRKEVLYIVGIGTTYLSRLVSEKRFPQPVPLGGRLVGWVDTEVKEWVENKIAQRAM